MPADERPLSLEFLSADGSTSSAPPITSDSICSPLVPLIRYKDDGYETPCASHIPKLSIPKPIEDKINPVLNIRRDQDALHLRIYDLSNEKARSFSSCLRRKKKPIKGIWHSSIVVFGYEYCFGQRGVVKLLPEKGESVMGMTLLEDWYVTHVYIDQEEFETHVVDLHEGPFRSEFYNMFHWNCHDFTEAIIQWIRPRNYPYVPGYCRHQISILEDRGKAARAAVRCAATVYNTFMKATKKKAVPRQAKEDLNEKFNLLREAPTGESDRWISAESNPSDLSDVDWHSTRLGQSSLVSSPRAKPKYGDITERCASFALPLPLGTMEQASSRSASFSLLRSHKPEYDREGPNLNHYRSFFLSFESILATPYGTVQTNIISDGVQPNIIPEYHSPEKVAKMDQRYHGSDIPPRGHLKTGQKGFATPRLHRRAKAGV